MEPLRIHLKNFTSYVDEQIDVSTVRLAALVGANGAGKSSIIDALTWALFGEGTKGGSKALDNYVRRGAKECRVTVDFALHGQVYRVVRQRSPDRGKTLLELYRQDGDQWETMSGKTVTETQQRIGALLRMDYRTFTASSVILQGKADSLTADMTDQERKEVLARILGLDLWDKLQESARERSRQAKAEVKALADQVAGIQQRAARRAEVEAAIAQQTAELQAAEVIIQQAAAQAADLEAQVRQRPALEQQILDLEQQITARNLDKQQAEADIASARREIEQQQALLSRRAQIEADLTVAVPAAASARQQAEELQQQVTDLEVMVLAGAETEQALRDLEGQIAARCQEMEQVAAEGRQVRDTLDQQQVLLSRAQEIRAAEAEVAELEQWLATLDELRQRWADLDLRARDLERQTAAWNREQQAKLQRLRSDISSCEAQTALLGEVPCQGTDLQPRCRLLASAVAAAGELDNLRQRLAEAERETNPHSADWQTAVRELDALGYDSQEHARVRDRLAQVRPISQQVAALEAAEQRAAELLERINTMRQRYTALQAEVTSLEQRAAGLRQTVAALDELRQRLQNLRSEADAAKRAADAARERAARLQQSHEEAVAQEEQARRRIADLEKRIQSITERIANIDAEIARLHDRHSEVEQVLAASIGLFRQLEQAQAVLADARHREAEARESLGRLRAELEQVAAAEQEAANIRERIAKAERKALVYEILDQACGKRAGVPALIVENAVPTIEAIANDLLGRMTGGRLQVRLDTTAETKAGTQQEVLRITVLDGGQERPYQTYSGAERFMVDLALRIALSKFLAHRSGAEIRLLVLDEGLGALDGSNRQQVMTAIQEAAREFSRVLVVTHIAELQDAFPQRIEVNRGPNGSTVKVAG